MPRPAPRCCRCVNFGCTFPLPPPVGTFMEFKLDINVCVPKIKVSVCFGCWVLPCIQGAVVRVAVLPGLAGASGI